MTKTLILTGSEVRHTFVRKAISLSPGIDVCRSFCEGTEKNLQTVAEAAQDSNAERLDHLARRSESERDFMGAFADLAPDTSNPVFIPKGAINDAHWVQETVSLEPDLIAAYGCSIIREPLLSAFPRRFLNVHLGLSPYYRGGGTNFWPLVNGEPEYVGVTFMYIDAGIDTGEVIHQMRARIFPGDTIHQIGHRLIVDMTPVYARLLTGLAALPSMEQPATPKDEKYYRRKDFSEEAVKRMYDNIADGMIDTYLDKQAERCARVPIITNTGLEVAQ
jgi:folate-dependent phosphoribosylglycinamide formyltransferase PurN